MKTAIGVIVVLVSVCSPAVHAQENLGVAGLGQKIDELDRFIRLNPASPIAHTERGKIHLPAGHFKQAVADFTVAITLIPQNATVYRNRGAAY
ncbi:tetratricopeptide repeat protein [Pararhizobium sp.]|uniref:tetratricopeptide repeat protein n=1 Tax=Pararhizobium sp. TaxID=1977563 RepID=UPI003D0F6FC0